MACVQAADVNRRRFGDHIPLHVDRKRTIVDALHIDARNAAEPLRRHVNLCHKGSEGLRPQPCACVGDVRISAIVIKNIPHLIGHDGPADPLCIENHAHRHYKLWIAIFDVEQRFAISRQECAQIYQRLDAVRHFLASNRDGDSTQGVTDQYDLSRKIRHFLDNSVDHRV
jgi:hypothetical protein